MVIFPSTFSRDPNLWKEMYLKGNYAHLLRDPKTGKILSIEVGKKTSMGNKRTASEWRQKADRYAAAELASGHSRANQKPIPRRKFS